MLLPRFRFNRLTATCTIGLVRTERFRSGYIGLLEVVSVPVHHFHTLNTVLRHESNRFSMWRLFIPTVFEATS